MRQIIVKCDKSNCKERITLGTYWGGIFFANLIAPRSKRVFRRDWKTIRSIGWGTVDDGDGYQSLDYCPKHNKQYIEEVARARDSYVPEYR